MKKLAYQLKRLSAIDIITAIAGLIILSTFYIVFRRDVASIVVRFKITDENPLCAKTLPGNEYANSFLIGDTENNESGRVTAEIMNVDSYRVKPDQAVVYLDIKMQTVYKPKKNQYTAQGKNISYGETFLFSFSKVNFRAQVVDFPGFREQNAIKETKTLIRAQLRDASRFYSDSYGVPPYLADAIKANDIVKNSRGDTLLRITNISVKPAKRTVTDRGHSLQIQDPELKDVFYTIELSTQEINGQLYMFDYQPVLVGALVPINLPTVSVFPTITEIVKTEE